THVRQGIRERLGRLIEVASRETAFDPRRVDLDTEDRGAGHRSRERLGTAHSAETGRQDRAPAEIRAPEVLLACRRKRLVRALEDSLRADVDPRSCGHL